jgi:hypothetical protein
MFLFAFLRVVGDCSTLFLLFFSRREERREKFLVSNRDQKE